MGLVNLVALLKNDADKQDFVDVPVPEWGGEIRIWRLDAADWVHFVDRLNQYELDEAGNFVRRSQMLDFGVELLAKSIGDEQGNRVWDSEEGRRKLRFSPFVAVRLMKTAMDLSGLAGDVDASIDAAKKN